jgi:tRNA(Ile)-lysidine synthase
MKYVVAVSGGVDSVVLLHMLKNSGEHELIVAHFDHGIRKDSSADARFVAALAETYDLVFETARKNLGEHASEDAAREARYEFLRSVAAKHQAKIVTAHHQDDVVETIAINLSRGTGWRGLAVLNDATIERPLLTLTKQQIRDYALEHALEWVEDSTNASGVYLRNRIRRKTAGLPDETKQKLMELFMKQRDLTADIDAEVAGLITFSRYFMTMIDETTALEILRGTLVEHSLSLTRPQRQRLLHAIRTAQPGNVFEAGSGVSVDFRLRDFIVKRPL